MNEELTPGNVRSNDGLGLVPEREDAISRSKRILALLDFYIDRQDRQNRTALRVALMTEFDAAVAAERERCAGAVKASLLGLSPGERSVADIAVHAALSGMGPNVAGNRL